MASVRDGAIVEAYRRRGYDVVGEVRPNLSLAYIATATVEGAAAGFAVSGGEIVAAGGTVLGVGAGGAPGIGIVLGVMAADATAVLVGPTERLRTSPPVTAMTWTIPRNDCLRWPC